MLLIIPQKLVSDEAKGVRWVIMCHGMMGFFAKFASITVKTMIITAEPASEPITKGWDHASEFPPNEVASMNKETEITSVVAPSQSTLRSFFK